MLSDFSAQLQQPLSSTKESNVSPENSGMKIRGVSRDECCPEHPHIRYTKFPPAFFAV